MISASITAFFTALSECAKTLKADIENKVVLSAVKEDKRQEKAIIEANKAFDLILRNIDYLPEDVSKEFLKHKKRFDKNITQGDCYAKETINS